MKTRQCSLAVLAILLAGVALAAGAETCGLRPPADKEAVHPADLNADGEVTVEEFQEYAEAQASALLSGGGAVAFSSFTFGCGTMYQKSSYEIALLHQGWLTILVNILAVWSKFYSLGADTLLVSPDR
jgi:hypothetical protein